MERKLSLNQEKILKYLRERQGEGLPPSVREICAATGIKSTSCVHTNLGILEEMGYLKRDSGHSRGIRLNGARVEQVPLLGRVTAGLPILAVEQIEGYIPFHSRHGSGRELFALRVVGESMKNAGILDGDIVIAERCATAQNRQIVIAMIDEEATVKRFFAEEGRVRLQPENDAFDPIYSDHVILLGRVIASLRSYEEV